MGKVRQDRRWRLCHSLVFASALRLKMYAAPWDAIDNIKALGDWPVNGRAVGLGV